MSKVNFEMSIKHAGKTVQFDESWNNGTGYLDGAVRADLGLAPGETATSTDPHGRRIVFVGTRLGNVVVFERYKDRDVIVSNMPTVVSKITGARGDLSDDQCAQILGGGVGNVGRDIEELLNAIADAQDAEPA